MGEAVRGAVEAVAREPLRPDPDPDWFAALGRVAPRWALWLAGAAVLAPGLTRAASAGGGALAAQVALAAAFAALAWHSLVPTLWILAAPVLVTGLRPRRSAFLLSLAPALALGALGAAASFRGFVSGTWLSGWEMAGLAVVLALCAAPVARAPGGGANGSRTARRGVPLERGTRRWRV